MSQAAIVQTCIQLDGSGDVYLPGEVLSGSFWAPPLDDLVPKAAELSVLWYTEGKGDEDMAVHHFQRYEYRADSLDDWSCPGKFSTPLPNSPLSYDGFILKILWTVRLRVFYPNGRSVTIESPFRLGNVPPPDLSGS